MLRQELTDFALCDPGATFLGPVLIPDALQAAEGN